MGYAAWFELDVVGAADKEAVIGQLIEQNEKAGSAFNDDGSCCGEASWYYCVEEMMEFSKKHPGVLFQVTCGQDDGSYWRAYIRDGLYHFSDGRLEYDEFDETKLRAE